MKMLSIRTTTNSLLFISQLFILQCASAAPTECVYETAYKVDPVRETIDGFTDNSKAKYLSEPRMSESFDKCNMSPADYIKQMRTTDFEIVDIRASQSFARYRISGSINIPVSQIKYKGFLKNSALLLIDDGKSGQHIYDVCGDLRNEGFGETYVLDGGLLGWSQSIAPLEGVANRGDELHKISIPDLYRVRDDPQWRLVTDDPQLEKYRSEATYDEKGWLLKRAISFTGSVSDISQTCGNEVRNLALAVPESLFNQLKDDPALGDYNLFMLQGKIPSYISYKTRQTRVSDKTHFVLQEPRFCQ